MFLFTLFINSRSGLFYRNCVYRIQSRMCCFCKSKVAFSNSETDLKDIRADCRVKRLTLFAHAGWH